MAWFTPSPLEISCIEQIETAYHDDGLNENQRQDLIETYWARLERAHGCKVLHIVSPQGECIYRPFDEQVS